MKRTRTLGRIARIAAPALIIVCMAMLLTGCDMSGDADDSSVTSVTVNPSTGTATVATGGSLDFTATVAVTGDAAQTVDWSIEGNLVADTTITPAGALSVDLDETAETLTVRATSTADPTKYDTATVTITKLNVKAITSVAALTAYLEGLKPNTAANPRTVPLAITFNTGTVQSGQIAWADINTALADSGKYVILDLSASSAMSGTTANTIAGDSIPTGNDFNIIQDNAYIKSIILPDTLISIGNAAFFGCYALTSVSIGGGVTTIGDYAFRVCRGLTSVTIPSSVTSVGEKAFYGCSGLTSVTVQCNLTGTGASIFSDCDALTSVTIGEGVTSIGERAFSDCLVLTNVTIAGSVTSIENHAFNNCPQFSDVIFEAGSNISTAWKNEAFSRAFDAYSNHATGTSLWNVYRSGSKPGRYTRNGLIWTQVE